MNEIIKCKISNLDSSIYCFNDMIIGKSLKNHGIWEPVLSSILSEIIMLIRGKKKDFVFLDIGAHVGYYSVLCKSLAKHSIVHSFEPNPDNLVVLNKNADMHENFNVYANAIFNKNGEMDFHYYDIETGGGSLFKENLGPWDSKVCKVNVKKISDFDIDLKEVSLIKIDTQGTETAILKDILPFLNKNTFILVEADEEMDDYIKDSKIHIVGKIGNNYFLQTESDKYISIRG